jgi:predicted RNA-binding protein YlxR (DUF448 family)
MRTVPVRTCVGCRARSPQADLIRVVRGRDGVARVDDAWERGDARGRAEGRGAYLCPRRSCIVRARRSGSLKRALGVETVTPDGLTDELLRRFPEEEGHG